MTRCSTRKPTVISYHDKDSWVRAYVHNNCVKFDKYHECPLDAKQCLQLADWLVKAATQISACDTCRRGQCCKIQASGE